MSEGRVQVADAVADTAKGGLVGDPLRIHSTQRRNGVRTAGHAGTHRIVVVHEVRARRADTAAISPLRPLHPRLEVEHELQQGSASKAGTPACAALLSR